MGRDDAENRPPGHGECAGGFILSSAFDAGNLRLAEHLIYMKRDAHYVIVYDVSEDRERRQVAKVVESEGFRVQKSVFECRLNARGLRRLMTNLEKLNLQTGGVRIYRSNNCGPECSVHVQAAPHPEEAFCLVS